MAEGKTKNLCAQIPEELHSKVSAERERSGQTLSQYDMAHYKILRIRERSC